MGNFHVRVESLIARENRLTMDPIGHAIAGLKTAARLYQLSRVEPRGSARHGPTASGG